MRKHLFKQIHKEGVLPAGLENVNLFDREGLTESAGKLFDTNPNIVAAVTTPAGSQVIKLFDWRHRIHYFLSIGMASRAQQSWNVAEAILKAGARTPKPVFVHTVRRWGLVKKNLYITTGIEPHKTLRKFLKSNPDQKTATAVVKDFALGIARIHNQGITHNDLTPGNILVDEKLQTYLVDLNRAKLKKKISVRHRLRDMAKVNLGNKTNTNKELYPIFFEAYCQESDVAFNWQSGYEKYRANILRYRRRKRSLKKLFLGK